MRWFGWVVALLLAVSAFGDQGDESRKEVRLIRRAYLDVLGLLPTLAEIEWFTVFNQNGYQMAVQQLTGGLETNGWKAADLLSVGYREQAMREVGETVLQRNVVYLAGMAEIEVNEEVFEKGANLFTEQAIRAGEGDARHAVDYMVNALLCRPMSASEENEMMELYNVLSRKNEERDVFRTLLTHILRMPDCRYK